MSSGLKAVKQVLPAQRPHWVGDGFHVFPVFAGKAFTNDVSPFLMFDYAAPKQFPGDGKRRGVGRHPHRGFETVTLAFQGDVEHADSVGNRDVIGAGDVQWMTAGRGIVHEEFHSTEFARTGGVFEMCQLWLNLPASKKMTPPTYQGILKAQIAEAPLLSLAPGAEPAAAEPAAGSVRVIAGEFNGACGPARTHTQVDMWDIALAGGADDSYVFDTVPGNNVILFCRRGRVEVNGSSKMGPQDVALLDRASPSTRFTLRPLERDSAVLLLAGAPLDEPIANQGPMVMNTQAELQQAFSDYQSGKFGR